MMRRACVIVLLGALVAWPAAGAPEEQWAAVAFEDASPERPGVAARLQEISLRVGQAVDYPPIARRSGVSGEAIVSFEIRPDGVPQDIAIRETSGSGALDAAARRAVERAAPLPFVYGRISVPVRFTLERR